MEMVSFTAADLDNIQVLYCTASLGMHPSHSLRRKLNAIAAAGFTGIELGFDDLVNFTLDRQNPKVPVPQSLKEVPSDDIDGKSEREIHEYYGAIEGACEDLRKLCDELGLEIYCLQPFSMFEGYTGDKRQQNFAKAQRWFKLIRLLGCHTLQVGSNPDTTTSPTAAIEDLRELSDLAAKYNPPINIAYENWCWAAHFPTWSDIYDVAQKVDRSNFGLCLDTFQSAGSELGDPSTASGYIEKPGLEQSQLEHQWKESCKALSTTIPKEKIFYLQISDAVKPEPRITEGDSISGVRGEWSHGFRPLPYSADGYLPWMDFTKAVLNTEFKGRVSMEVFENKMQEEGWELEAYAKRAMEVWRKMKVDLLKE